MRGYEWEELLLKVIAIFGIVFFAGVAVFGTIDGIGQLRAQSATMDCRAKQMDAMRYWLTDSVVCVPFPTRRDTLAIQEAR